MTSLPIVSSPRSPFLWRFFWVLLWIGLSVFYARDHRFPYYYHTDEPTKADQVYTGTRNFNHPQLLLNSADLLSRLTGQHGSRQTITETGRCCSAGFAALAVVLAAWTARRLVPAHLGWLAVTIVVVVCGLHPLLYELAHYFKEDAALLCGMMCVLAAVTAFEAAPSPRTVILLGTAAGVAISAKYIGGIWSGLALLPLLAIRAPEGISRWKWLGIFTGAFLITVAVINYQVLTHPGQPLERMSGEMDKLAVKPHGVETGVIQWDQLGDFLESWPWVIWAMVLLGMVEIIRRWKTQPWSVRLSVVFSVVYLILLAVTPRVRERYFLPLVVISGWVFALTVLAAIGRVQSRGKATAIFTVVASLLLVGWVGRSSLSGVRKLQRDFRSDTTSDLAHWIRENLPKDAVIASGSRVMLPTEENPWFEPTAALPALPQKNPRRSYLADYGSIDEMRRQGITYVVQDVREWGPYLQKGTSVKGAAQEKFDRRRQFYLDLQARSELLWQRKVGQVVYLHPALRLYRLPKPADKP